MFLCFVYHCFVFIVLVLVVYSFVFIALVLVVYSIVNCLHMSCVLFLVLHELCFVLVLFEFFAHCIFCL